ncbi:hypothetical protein MTQ22_10650 [Corynebacterium bovis]
MATRTNIRLFEQALVASLAKDIESESALRQKVADLRQEAWSRARELTRRGHTASDVARRSATIGEQALRDRLIRAITTDYDPDLFREVDDDTLLAQFSRNLRAAASIDREIRKIMFRIGATVVELRRNGVSIGFVAEVAGARTAQTLYYRVNYYAAESRKLKEG